LYSKTPFLGHCYAFLTSGFQPSCNRIGVVRTVTDLQWVDGDATSEVCKASERPLA
jgi:hypothetical protein